MTDMMRYVSLVLVIAVAYAALAGGLRSFTAPALVGVLVPIVLLGAVLIRRRPAEPAPPSRPGRGALLWLVPALAFGVLEGLSVWVWHDRSAHPSLSIALDRPLEWHAVRSLAVFGWLAAGWALVRR